MKQITINAYEIDELSEKAKQKAIDRQIEFENETYYFDDCDKEYLQDLWAEMGIEDTEFDFDIYRGYFRLKEGSINHPKIAQALKLNSKHLNSLKIHLYFANGECVYDTDWTYDEDTKEMNGVIHKEGDDLTDYDKQLIKDTKEMIDQAIEDKERECLKIMREIFEDLSSEERAIESIKANEYLFRENGDLI